MSNTERIPFDLEQFKQGAVAVDEFDLDRTWDEFDDTVDGFDKDWFYREQTTSHWHMKPPTKFIVYREFESEDEAKRWLADIEFDLGGDPEMKIEKR